MTSKGPKRTRGTIRNIANQLVQIAAGWEAGFDGPVLLREPRTGRYKIDLIENVSMVNDHRVDLGMTSILDKWLHGELARLRRGGDWIIEATLEVKYELVPSGGFMDSNPGFWTSQAFVARLSATAHVATSEGAAEATFKNAQAVTGQVADTVRPMPQHHVPSTLKGGQRPFQIKGRPPAKPQRDASA